MTTQVIEVSRDKDCIEVEVATGNKNASVLFTKSAVYVLVRGRNNVSKIGRRFADVASAMAAYKCSAVREMIATACEVATA